MKLCIVAFICLLFAGILFAQPWHWQRMEGDFYHPTGFPERIHHGSYAVSPIAIGDFNSDGRAEYFDITASEYRIAVRDSDRFHWTVSDYPGEGRLGVTGLWAADLDQDGQDELVVYADSVTVLKAISYSPWTWQTRNDLLTGLYLPPHVQKAIFGDYDGDGLLNAVVWTRADTDRVDILHRNAEGAWLEDSTLHLVVFGHSYVLDIFDGDFNHDGRLDFGVSYSTGEFGAKDALTFVENTGHSYARHDLCLTCSTFSGGGDLDGDGQWEELERDFYNGEGFTHSRPGYYLRHTAADSANFIRFTDESYLGRFQGKTLGNFHTAHGGEIVGIFNRGYSRIDMFWTETELESRTPLGWQGTDLVHVYGGWFGDYYLMSASAADLNGDGRKDIVGLVGEDLSSADLTFFPNIGTDSLDRFSPGSGIPIMTDRFPYNADTVFSSPQIGDITGDGRAELALLAQPQGDPRTVQFYQIVGPLHDTTFVLHPEWSAGLPQDLLTICLADLDGDGIAELFGKAPGTDSTGHWDVYFFRNGVWERHDNILPNFSAADLSFADVNGDGHLDLITPNGVWLNLNPSKVDKGSSRLPSSFALSVFPNPFNPTTEIDFSVPVAGRVTLKVFNLLGQQVSVLQDGFLPSGEHRVLFDGGQLPAGIYFLRIEAATHQRTLKLVLLK